MIQRRVKKDKYKVSFVIVLLTVVLSFCIFIGSVLAWLQYFQTNRSVGQIVLGSVDFEIYSGETRLTSMKSNASGVKKVSSTKEFAIAGGSSIRSVNLEIRNTGTIHAIMRVTLEIYYKDDSGNKVNLIFSNTITQDNHISINNSDWVNDFKDGAASGYAYYNKQIAPYTVKSLNNETGEITTQDISANAVVVFSQLCVPETMKEKTYYALIQVDGVAYSGNIYQEDNSSNPEIETAAYPFGPITSIPSTWNAWE